MCSETQELLKHLFQVHMANKSIRNKVMGNKTNLARRIIYDSGKIEDVNNAWYIGGGDLSWSCFCRFVKRKMRNTKKIEISQKVFSTNVLFLSLSLCDR